MFPKTLSITCLHIIETPSVFFMDMVTVAQISSEAGITDRPREPPIVLNSTPLVNLKSYISVLYCALFTPVLNRDHSYA